MSAVGADVVLVGSILAAFGRDTLELLLSGSIGVTNLHDVVLLADGDAMEVLNDLLADLASLEAASQRQKACDMNRPGSQGTLPSETHTAAIAHGIAQNLAGDDVERLKDVGERLISVSRYPTREWRRLTFSLTSFGRLEM